MGSRRVLPLQHVWWRVRPHQIGLMVLRAHGKVEDVRLVCAVDNEIVDEVRRNLRGLASV